MPRCIPFASGVPFSPGPPGFINPPGAGGIDFYNNRLDDPRWRGAARISHGDGLAVTDPERRAGELCGFRALHHTSGTERALYLIWSHVNFTPLISTGTELVFGIHVPSGSGGSADPTATTTLAIRINPFTETDEVLRAVAPDATLGGSPVSGRPSVAVFQLSGGNWALLTGAAVPQWIAGGAVSSKVRSWFANDVAGGERWWGVAVKIPLLNAQNVHQGISLAQQKDFRLWFEARHRFRLPTQPEDQPDKMVRSKWTRTIVRPGLPAGTDPATAPSYDLDGATPIFPAVTDWETFSADVAAGAVCNAGISIGWGDIGTTGNASANEIVPGTNTFFARPTIDPKQTLAAGALSATFRLANWGTQPAALGKETDRQLWTVIAPAVPSQAITDTTPTPLQALITGTGNIPINDYGESGSGKPYWRHQCMLVELTGAGLEFKNDSIYSNMNFPVASLADMAAQVNVKTLGPDPAGRPNRDIFLCVQRLNMPEQVNPQDGLRTQKLANLLWETRGQKLPPGAGLGDNEGDNEGDDSGSSFDGRRDDPLEIMERFVPMLKIFAFHETGTVESIGGLPVGVWSPQVAFQCAIRHDGPLHGWDYQIEGADMIAPDVWKVRVPNETAKTVRVRVLAKDTPTDQLDHSNDSKSDCERALEAVRDDLYLIRRQIARCCPRKLRIQAEHFLATGGTIKDRRSGFGVERHGGFIGKVNDGDWAVYGNLDFDDFDWKQAVISFVSVSPGRRIELYTDALDSLPEYLSAAGKKPPARLSKATLIADWELPSTGRHWAPPFQEQASKLDAVPKGKQLVIAVFKKGKHSDPCDVAFVDWFELQA